MLKFAVVIALIAAAPLAAQTAPAVPAAPPAPAVPVAPAAARTPEQLAHDPRMIAAIRHANLTADAKCGDVGGFVTLEEKARGRTCRRHMVEAAKLDAEGEIAGH